MLPVYLMFCDAGEEQRKSIYIFDPKFDRIKSLNQEEAEIIKTLLRGSKTLRELSGVRKFVDFEKQVNNLLDSKLIKKVNEGSVELKANVIDIDLSLIFKTEYQNVREVVFGLISAMTFFIRKTYEEVFPEDKKGSCNILRSLLMYHALWQLRHQESLFDWEEKYVVPNIERVSPVIKKWMDMLLQFEDPSKAVADWAKTGIPSLRESEFSLYKEK